ncbi:MAG: chromosome partitioning protein ParB [Rhodoferax ferrireducens]|uniref:Chromosome partitioning protein ParB n=2 Tax=Pseudomonadota TaxID=1224 RepID=A0A1Y1R0J3_9GAMM|nr:MAG: chromosome partitioning protein ParB [Rhodoferax ferrireducens]OQX17436.1 MAG: chromosome partitioning protein ParB [Thiothrix lacustris]
MNKVGIAFTTDLLQVPLDNILPLHKAPPNLLLSIKYKQIKASIVDVGMIEPLSVSLTEPNADKYMLLDGHVRLSVARELAWVTVPCLVASDDESYTYNNRINRLSSVQEHLMLRRAVERGVAPERLAKALCVNIGQITRKVNLLQGICPEAISLLKDRQFSPEVARILRKMKPTRQVECIDLMSSANTLTISYAEAMLAATPAAMLVEGKKPARLAGVGNDQVLKMERELGNLQTQYKLVEQTYGQEVLNLVLAKGYLTKLLRNESVAAYLRAEEPELFAEFESIVQTTSLE